MTDRGEQRRILDLLIELVVACEQAELNGTKSPAIAEATEVARQGVRAVEDGDAGAGGACLAQATWIFIREQRPRFTYGQAQETVLAELASRRQVRARAAAAGWLG